METPPIVQIPIQPQAMTAPTPPAPQAPVEEPQQPIAPEQSPATEVATAEIVEKVPGGYSFTRHILLVVLIALAVVIIASLIYLNGKSIYTYGL